MAYRSDVRIRLTKEDFERLKKEFDENIKIDDFYHLFKHLSVCKEETDRIVYKQDDTGEWLENKVNSVYFGWDCTKWYENYGFDDVDFIMNFVMNCEQYAFIRIGESMEGDIDSIARGFDNIGFYYAFDDE
jgi:hypothetical protein